LLLLRKPLLEWTLEAVRDSSLIDDCVVTSDDPDVLQIAANDPYVFLLNQRPARLARDNTPTEAVMEHVLRQYVCTRAHWDTTHCRLGGKVALYEMSEEHALQIDTALDMELCAAVLARRHGTVPGVRRANRVSR
jgi:CMP-N-acetylneuraminic acid synthetase